MERLTLRQALDRNRKACIKQLYQEWGGYYQVVRLFRGRYVKGKRLTYREALRFHCSADQALRLVFPTIE